MVRAGSYLLSVSVDGRVPASFPRALQVAGLALTHNPTRARAAVRHSRRERPTPCTFRKLYSGAKVANRNANVRHGATENGP